MPSVVLASGHVGKLSVSVIAFIAEDGALRVDRDDSGPGASMTGADEEESIAAIDKEDKDRLLPVSIIAFIAEDGDLHVTRHDSGPGASMTGADEEESIAAIDKEDKDRLLLALLERDYGGNTSAQHEIAKFAASKGIKVTRFHWP